MLSLLLVMALLLAWLGAELQRYGPLLQPAPVCPGCGRRVWRVAT